MKTRIPEQDLDTRQSPYPVDLEDASEAARLTILSRVLTRHLADLMPDALRHRSDLQVLDIGCGPGGWVHDVAYHYPKGEATGLDLSRMMLGLAQSGAQAQGLNNALFERVDATQPLPFSDNCFDLVQARFCNSFLLKQTWPGAVREWVRVTRPGGFVRLIESDGLGQSNDACFEQLRHLVRVAWETDARGRVLPVTPWLGQWLHQAGCVDLQERGHLLDFSTPFPQQEENAYEEQYERHVSMCEALATAFTLLQPFVRSQPRVPPATLDWLCEQTALNMRQPTFRGHFWYLDVVGHKPAQKQRV